MHVLSPPRSRQQTVAFELDSDSATCKTYPQPEDQEIKSSKVA